MEMGTAPFRISMTEHEARQTKTCTYCGHTYPLSAFRRRTGKRAGAGSRRGACRNCRQLGANKGEPMAGLASGPAWSGQRSVDAAALQARDEGRASSETKDLSGASGIGKPRKNVPKPQLSTVQQLHLRSLHDRRLSRKVSQPNPIPGRQAYLQLLLLLIPQPSNESGEGANAKANVRNCRR